MENFDNKVIEEVDSACIASIRQILNVYFNSITEATSQEELANQVNRTKKGIGLALRNRLILRDSLLTK